MYHPKSKEEVVQEFRIQTIQEATMRVIARKGMAAATMQEIAEEAGVAKGTLYLYFRDRDELVEKTFESAMNTLMVHMEQALDRDLPLEARIREIMRAKLEFFANHREFVRLYLSLRMPEAQARRHQKDDCREQYRGRLQKLASVLEQAMERGEIRRLDPYRLALFMVEGSTAIVIERLAEETSPEVEAEVDLITGLVFDGIRKRS